MFSSVLQSLCQAVSTALERTAGWRFSAGEVTQIGKESLQFDAVAALHYWEGPVRRLIVGCDRSVVQQLAAAQENRDADSVDELPADELSRIGLGAFCSTFQELLAAEVDWEKRDREFLVHDADKFQVRSAGAHNYWLRLDTPAGTMHVVLDMASREAICNLFQMDRDDDSQPRTIAQDQIDIHDPDEIQEVMNYLAEHESGIEVKNTTDDGRVDLFHATVVRSSFDAEQRTLGLTCAGIGQKTEQELVGQQVFVIFAHQDRLLGFNSTIERYDRLSLDSELYVPVIRVAFPEQITFGQRRGATRVEPDMQLLGTLQRSEDLTDSETPSLLNGVPFRVVDISATGVKLAVSAGMRLSGYKWGTRVVSEIDLPHPFGTIAFEAEVRRLTMLTAGATQRGVHLSLEYTRPLDDEQKSLESLREFIRSCLGAEEDGYLGMELKLR